MQSLTDNWDDLRFVLAIARSGSFLHAGRELGTAASTVQRRFGALERRLGARLGDRTAGGIALTAEGRRLLSLAEDVEARIAVASRDLAGADTRLSGRIRVTAGDGFAAFLLRVAATFRAEYPDVSIDLALDHRVYDLSRREADIGLRNTRPTAKPLIARRLGELEYGLYAAAEYIRKRPLRSLAELGDHAFIGLLGPAENAPVMRWLREAVQFGWVQIPVYSGLRLHLRSLLEHCIVSASWNGLSGKPKMALSEIHLELAPLPIDENAA